MHQNINKIRNGFFKKSLSVGYHNTRYTWMQIMLVIITCIRGLESFEEGAKSPSAQTVRDRLWLDGKWLEYFHETAWRLAQYIVKHFPRVQWYICIDETHTPFFGAKKKINNWLKSKGLEQFVFGYKAKTPGATGSFCFLVISLCCNKIRLPLFIKIVSVQDKEYRKWIKKRIKRTLRLVPQAFVLADRGFGKATWFFIMLEKLNARYVVRAIVRKEENKNKVKLGVGKYQYWMKDTKTKEKVLLTVYTAKDKQGKSYYLASNLQGKSPLQLLSIYMNRWDIENLFKDSDRVMLPTSSRNPRMRLFSVVISFFLFALWQFEKVIDKVKNSIRGFVKNCIRLICQSLKCIITSVGIIINTTFPEPP